jgi:hypothetical protein
MPQVKVKGVKNKMQFPDDMGIDDIRSFLQRKFAKQAVEGSQPVDLAPLQGQARATEQSLAEKAGQGISNALYDSGIVSDRYGAQRIGENITNIGEFLPGIGDAAAGDEFGRALKQGDGVGMALGALGAVPIAGDLAKKGVKVFRGQPKGVELRLNDKGVLWVTPDKSYAQDPHYGGKDGSEVVELSIDDSNIYDPAIDIDKLLVEGKNRKIQRPLLVSAAKGNFRAIQEPEITNILKDMGYDGFKAIEPEGQASIGLFDIGKAIKTPSTNKAMSVGDMPMGQVKPVTSYNDMYDFTPEQMAQQLRSSNPENVVDGVYIEPTAFGE